MAPITDAPFRWGGPLSVRPIARDVEAVTLGKRDAPLPATGRNPRSRRLLETTNTDQNASGPQSAADQGQVGGLDRDVGAGTHG